MMRFFRVAEENQPALREAVRAALGQPNGSADSPWGEHGDFAANERAYIAFGPYHCERFADLIEQFLDLPGVEEITREEYHEAMPKDDG